MAYPPDYNKATNFTEYAGNNPAAPYNAPDHDAEFANIDLTLSAVVDLLKTVTRADGKLANNSVTPEALSTVALQVVSAGWNPRGAWATGTAYSVGDLAEGAASISFVCAKAHTAAANIDIDRGAGRWVCIGNGVSAAVNDIINYATQAATARDAAVVAKGSAEAAAATATTKATEATNSATSAAANATSANASAVSASASEASATASKNSATASAAAAAMSAAQAENRVSKTSDTGAAQLPSGTTAERDAVPIEGMIRYNKTTKQFEGYSNGLWQSVGGGQMLGLAETKGVFFNAKTITENLTIKAGTNGGSFGPMTINDDVTVTIEDGAAWTIV